MIRNSVLAAAVLLLAACASQTPAASAAADENGAGAQPGKVVTFKESADEDTWSFGYSRPAQANAIAPLDALLLSRKDKVRAERRGFWEEARSDCPPDAVSCMSHYYEEHWAVVADLPRWLSLSASIESYSGGAHGNLGFDALLWDKVAGKLREPSELFQSKRLFVDAVRAEFCAALDKERAERRGGDSMSGFDECPDPTETVIVLGSSNGMAIDQIGFLIAPYIAGPYVEGAYDVTLPVTPQVLSKVKREFRGSFAEAK
jgi:hypothetical protein